MTLKQRLEQYIKLQIEYIEQQEDWIKKEEAKPRNKRHPNLGDWRWTVRDKRYDITQLCKVLKGR